MCNCCSMFIGPDGVRTTNNPNEIAHYEFASVLASDGMMDALNHVEVGIKEMELGEYMSKCGQRNSVVTIASTGERFQYGNLYPANNIVKVGDKMSLTVGYRGGLSSRAGYAVESADQLPNDVKDWLDKLVKPYYQAVVTWLEKIEIGMTGDELYQNIYSGYSIYEDIQKEINRIRNKIHV